MYLPGPVRQRLPLVRVPFARVSLPDFLKFPLNSPACAHACSQRERLSAIASRSADAALRREKAESGRGGGEGSSGRGRYRKIAFIIDRVFRELCTAPCSMSSAMLAATRSAASCAESRARCVRPKRRRPREWAGASAPTCYPREISDGEAWTDHDIEAHGGVARGGARHRLPG